MGSEMHPPKKILKYKQLWSNETEKDIKAWLENNQNIEIVSHHSLQGSHSWVMTSIFYWERG